MSNLAVFSLARHPVEKAFLRIVTANSGMEDPNKAFKFYQKRKDLVPGAPPPRQGQGRRAALWMDDPLSSSFAIGSKLARPVRRRAPKVLATLILNDSISFRDGQVLRIPGLGAY